MDSEIELALRERELSAHCVTELEKFYPKQLWTAEAKSGVVIIRNLALHGQWGFVVHQTNLNDLSKTMMRRGGELLERFRISRTAKLGEDQAREHLVKRFENVTTANKLPSYVR